MAVHAPPTLERLESACQLVPDSGFTEEEEEDEEEKEEKEEYDDDTNS